MIRLSGYTLAAMGVLHGIMSVLLFADLLADIFQGGHFSGLSWSLDMLAATIAD